MRDIGNWLCYNAANDRLINVGRPRRSCLTLAETKTKYYRLFGDPSKPRDESELSLKLKGITGLHADDYVPAVTRESGEIVTLISDESEFKGHVAVSLVVLPYFNHEELHQYETALQKLVARAGLSRIHFSEIFGRKRVVGRDPAGFLDTYADIVSAIPISCLSLSKRRVDLVRSFQADSYNNEELFHSLFWNNVDRVADGMLPYSILHIYREVDNNFTLDECVRAFHKLLSGVSQIESLSRRNLSVCRHPHFFTKKGLLYSSLADLVAYGSNSLQYKLDIGISGRKIARRHKALLVLLKRVFTNYTGLASSELVELVRAN